MWIIKPIRLGGCRGLWQFIVRILAQQFVVKGIVAVGVAALLPDLIAAEHTRIDDPVLAFLGVIVLAPVLETLLLQSLPIEICRRMGRKKRAQFLWGWLPFAALHFPMGAVAGLAAGTVGGAYFSHTYLECRSRSWWTSVRITMATHALHNLIVFPLLFLLPR